MEAARARGQHIGTPPRPDARRCGKCPSRRRPRQIAAGDSRRSGRFTKNPQTLPQHHTFLRNKNHNQVTHRRVERWNVRTLLHSGPGHCPPDCGGPSTDRYEGDQGRSRLRCDRHPAPSQRASDIFPRRWIATGRDPLYYHSGTSRSACGEGSCCRPCRWRQRNIYELTTGSCDDVSVQACHGSNHYLIARHQRGPDNIRERGRGISNPHREGRDRNHQPTSFKCNGLELSTLGLFFTTRS